MAIDSDTNKVRSNVSQKLIDFDPDSTAATKAGESFDMSGCNNLMCTLFRSLGTGSITSFKLIANAESDGSGLDVEVKSHALGEAPDAVGNQIHLECSGEELAYLSTQNGVKLRYVFAEIALVTAGDECVLAYLGINPRFAGDGLTADITT